MAVKTYKDLMAWQRAMDMVVSLYDLTKSFPRDEIYGLTGQVKRAAVSVPSNIAEGQGRGVGNEFCHHLRISLGSLQEMETQVMIAQRLSYVSQEQIDPILAVADEVGKIVRGLHQSVSPNRGRTSN